MSERQPSPAVEGRTPNVTLNYAVIAVVFLLVGGVVGVVASNALIKQADVEAAVRTVLADTQVTIDDSALQTALAAFQSQTNIAAAPVDAETLSRLVTEALAQNEADKARAELVRIMDDDPYLGAEDAPITIVEFSAYACPYCARHFSETFKPLLENYGQYIRYVYRDYPVINQEVSLPTSMAAQCANAQGKFWEFHDTMFNNQSLLSREFYLQTATDEGLDIAQFTTCVDDETYSDEVMNDYYAGDALNITGTPTFYINGEIVSGALPYDRFERIILSKLKDLGIEAAAPVATS